MDCIVRELLELRLDPEVEPEPREKSKPFHGLRVVEGGGEPSLAVGEKGGEGLDQCAGCALDDRTVVISTSSKGRNSRPFRFPTRELATFATLLRLTILQRETTRYNAAGIYTVHTQLFHLV